MGKNLSISQKNDLLERRRRLEGRIAAFEQRSIGVMTLDDNMKWAAKSGKVIQ